MQMVSRAWAVRLAIVVLLVVLWRAWYQGIPLPFVIEQPNCSPEGQAAGLCFDL